MEIKELQKMIRSEGNKLLAEIGLNLELEDYLWSIHEYIDASLEKIREKILLKGILQRASKFTKNRPYRK